MLQGKSQKITNTEVANIVAKKMIENSHDLKQLLLKYANSREVE